LKRGVLILKTEVCISTGHSLSSTNNLKIGNIGISKFQKNKITALLKKKGDEHAW